MAQKIEIYIQPMSGSGFYLKVSLDEDLVRVGTLIWEKTGLEPDQITLLYRGKKLLDRHEGYVDGTLRDYNVENKSTLILDTSTQSSRYSTSSPPTQPSIHPISSRPSHSFGDSTWSPPTQPSRYPISSRSSHSFGYSTELVTDTSALKSYKAWESKASEGDFDQDLHIVDPRSHFHLLKQLVRDVEERSECHQMRGQYEVDEISDLTPMPDLPSWLQEKLDLVLPRRKEDPLKYASQNTPLLCSESTEVEMFEHLLKSYSIISNILKGIEQMTALRFCTDSINILMKHGCKNVIEIIRLDLILIKTLKTSLDTAIYLLLEDFNEDSFLTLMSTVGLPPCEKFLRCLGCEDIGAHITAPEAALRIIRKTVFLLDIALVSYVRSHGSDLGSPRLELEMESMKVRGGEEPFTFKCSWVKLACLDGFLDRRRVLVFDFFNPGRTKARSEREIATRPASVLTRMKDLADIWGPIYTVPTASGLIRHYVVSKGVICRVATDGRCAVPGAVQCHYYSRTSFSFLQRKAYQLMSRDPELLLAEDDMLLIGAGLKENRYCNYTLSNFLQDSAYNFMALGTKESVWKTDSRSASLGVSKLFGITVSGSQKLIPQTSLKQHILDKWTATPSRANPAIIKQFLGVELSHCTGNARRVSLGQLMMSDPILEILERQTPDWNLTPWGRSFRQALLRDDREYMFQVWKDFALDRASIAELLCCLLELLDNTGLVEERRFYAAMLYHQREHAFPIHIDMNDWSTLLRDTPNSAAYVMITDICLNCEVPDHSTSACHIQKAYTVLQTQFATKDPPAAPDQNESYRLRPDGPRLRQVDVGSRDITLLTPTSLSSNILSHFSRSRDCSEIRDQSWDSIANTVYIRASNRSFHGENRPKRHFAPRDTASSRQRQPNELVEAPPRYQAGYQPRHVGYHQVPAMPALNPVAEPFQPHKRQGPYRLGTVDDDFRRDVFGQNILPRNPSRHHDILNDLKNYEIDDDDNGNTHDHGHPQRLVYRERRRRHSRRDEEYFAE